MDVGFSSFKTHIPQTVSNLREIFLATWISSLHIMLQTRDLTRTRSVSKDNLKDQSSLISSWTSTSSREPLEQYSDTRQGLVGSLRHPIKGLRFSCRSPWIWPKVESSEIYSMESISQRIMNKKVCAFTVTSTSMALFFSSNVPWTGSSFSCTKSPY